jgi:class 3 adenylate cyclase
VIDGSEGRRTATVTVLFCDLVGSTERQTRVGDDAADEFRRRFFAALGECVRATDGEIVKNLGDGLMVVFRHSAVDAVRCAVMMHERVESLDHEDPARLYVGISAGEVAVEAGDWFGTPVVEAARLCAAAKPGQTLANEVVRTLVGSRGSFEFRSVGALALKGIPEPVACIEITRAVAGPAAPVADPVQGSRRGRPLLVAVVVAVLVVVIAATVAAVVRSDRRDGANSASPSTKGVPPVAYPIKYAERICPGDSATGIVGASCGTLTVPEDRTHPNNGHTVSLLVTRAPARSGATLDPVVDFGADSLANSPVREHAEEIQISERGFSPSAPVLSCSEYGVVSSAALTRPVRDPRTDADAERALGHCHDRLVAEGIDPNMYGLTATGDDVLDLLRALHLSHVNLVSGYVETIGALHVIDVAPGAIRTLTVQAPVPPGLSSFSDPTADLNAAFKRYVAQCMADAACAHNFPDLARSYETAYQYFRASPRIVHTTDPYGNGRDVLLTGDRVAQAVAASLMNRDVYPLLASGIAQATTPVLRNLIATQVLRYNDLFVHPGFAWGAYLAVHCSYDLATVDPGRTLSDQTLPSFSGVDDDFLAAVCPRWHFARLDEYAFDSNREYDTPTLIAQGGLNSGTSVDWGTALQQSMPHSTLVTFPTLDGDVVQRGGPSCFAMMRQQFIADPSAPLAVNRCEQESPPIHFVAAPPS